MWVVKRFLMFCWWPFRAFPLNLSGGFRDVIRTAARRRIEGDWRRA